MKKIIILIILLCLGLTQANQTLRVEDYINISLTKHPIMAKTKAEYMSQLKSLESVQGINDWNLFLSSSFTKGYATQGTTTYTPETEIYQFSGGATTLLAEYGTRLKIGSDTLLMKNSPSFLGGLTNVYSTNLNLSISQPILRNAFGKLDRYPLLLAKYNRQLVDLKYAEDLEDFYKTLVDEYLLWQLSYKTLNVTKEQLQKAKDQVALVTQQYNKGVSEKLDLVQAKQNLKAKTVQHLSAKQDLINKQIRIASRLGDGNIIDLSSLVPQTNLLLSLDLSKTECLNFIKNNSSLSKILTIQEQMQKETLSYKNDQTKPSAELFLSKTIGTAVNNSSSLLSNFGSQAPLTFGIKMETSLENTISNKDAQSAEYALEKIKKQNEEIIKLSLDGIHSIFENIEAIDFMIKENEELLALADEHTNLEEIKFKQGRSSLYFVIVAQDQFLNIKLQLEGLKTTKAMLLNQLSSQMDDYQKNPLLKSIINANKGDK